MKKRNLKDRITLDPIMTLLILIVLTIVISGFLSLLGVQVTYNSVTDNVTFNYTQNLIMYKKRNPMSEFGAGLILQEQQNQNTFAFLMMTQYREMPGLKIVISACKNRKAYTVLSAYL